MRMASATMPERDRPRATVQPQHARLAYLMLAQLGAME
jgi:hypothetical protein